MVRNNLELRNFNGFGGKMLLKPNKVKPKSS